MPLLEQRFGKANFSDCHLFEALVGPFLGRLSLAGVARWNSPESDLIGAFPNRPKSAGR